MSYEIDYRYVAFQFDGERATSTFRDLSVAQGLDNFYFEGPTPCVAQFVETGSSNSYERDSGRRARSWQLQHVGERYQVMRRVIHAAEYVESGLTKPFGRDQKAESYIAANRKRLTTETRPLETLFRLTERGTVCFSVHSFDAERAARNPWWQKAVAAGWVYTPPYGNEARGLRFQVTDLETLECALLCIADVGNGVCGTMASLGYTTALQAALERLSGVEQEQLFAAA